jgi:hypothetical protein
MRANTNYQVPTYGGVNLIVSFAPMQQLRVFYNRLRNEASWLSMCANGKPNQGYWFEYDRGGTTRGGPFPTATVPLAPPNSGGGELVIVSDRIGESFVLPKERHELWNGVTRVDHPWGVVFTWFDSAGPNDPNTIVYVCTTGGQCPP